ncbi:unnamed protein product [Rotaria sordida]|uniref:Uncharacterized protein n=1 Tax=Rotaria sordida TaxID=392033 RepID=A0A814TNQ7_9BILA|nr:unnamed protein product [Rotaria sordida]CAF1163321.1 unnamed protein product [Rotaria sordida]CAF1325683.1 unnamed protein product [Rotaria sordida]
MFLFGLTFSINLLFIFINAENHIGVNNVQRSAINMDVVEHEPNNNVHYDQSEQITPEKVLIRVPRLKTENEKLKINKRERRQLLDGEEILGMAKKVAIIVLVFVSLCTVCCFVTIIIICVKCCCGNNNRKRNAASTTVQVPQPIIVHHTGPSGYQPQYYQQPAPQSWNSVMVRPPESRPMLPQPSAPPRPNNDFHTEYVPPPPYEKLYTSN